MRYIVLKILKPFPLSSLCFSLKVVLLSNNKLILLFIEALTFLNILFMNIQNTIIFYKVCSKTETKVMKIKALQIKRGYYSNSS